MPVKSSLFSFVRKLFIIHGYGHAIYNVLQSMDFQASDKE